MKKFVAMALIVALAGCAAGPKDSRYSVSSPMQQGEGIIFGRICTGSGIGFTPIPSGEEIVHIGGRTAFALRLPAGRYTLSSIGSVRGMFASFDPYVVTVAPRQAIYVGTIIPSWTSARNEFRDACNHEESQIVSEKKYGLKGADWVRVIKGERKSDNRPVYVASDIEEAIKDLNAAYPSLLLKKPSLNLMQ
jgi:hypothetical protein